MGYPAVEIDGVMAFVERNIRLRAEINHLRREERYEYPLLALREILLNAIVHSDYSVSGRDIRVAIFDDRIEVSNPGALVPGLAMEDLYSGTSKLRNRIIGRVFRELGLIEQWGTGIGKVLRLCRDFALRAPLFQEIGDSFRVTLFNSGSDTPAFSDGESAVLQFLHTSKELRGIDEIAREIDESLQAVRKSIKRLMETGYVVEIKTSLQDRRKAFLITEKARRFLDFS
jgi:predicted HTH transcriptional regulator